MAAKKKLPEFQCRQIVQAPDDNLPVTSTTAIDALKNKVERAFSETINDEDLKRIQSDDWLQHLESNEFPGYASQCRFQTQGSELDYNRIINKLGTSDLSDTAHIRVSLLVGSSSILSSLPELARISDLVILIDIHPLRTRFFKHQMSYLPAVFAEIPEQTSLPEREHLYLLSHLSSLMRQSWIYDNEKAVIEHQLERLMLSYARSRMNTRCHSPFSSMTRWHATASAVQRIRIASIQMDIFNKDHIKRLAELLTSHEAEVIFFNLSNTINWLNSEFRIMSEINSGSALYESLSRFDLLPFSQTAYIAWAMMSSSLISYHQGEGSHFSQYHSELWSYIINMELQK